MTTPDLFTAEEHAVLDRFVVDGRLAVVPSKDAKWHLVLELLAQEFEPGERYAETEVNARLRGFHDDVANLRRRLVDAGLLARGEGVYHRCGGRVPDTP